MSIVPPEGRLELMNLRAENQILTSKFHILLSALENVKEDLSDIDERFQNDVPPPFLNNEIYLLNCYRRAPSSVKSAINRVLVDYLEPHEVLPNPLSLKERSDAIVITRRIVSQCEGLIHEYEDLAPGSSCVNDLLPAIRNRLDSSQEEVLSWSGREDSFFLHISHVLLANYSAELLESGKYHIYRGHLDPLSCGERLLSVYNQSLRWAVRNGEITKDQYKDQYHSLLSTIEEIG